MRNEMDIREQMNVVIIGHVDHGKSTVVGRLMADTGALPEGKLAEVKKSCAVSSRPFEYAFLLDALKDEQSQGITIDTARCFFKSESRDYIIIDAPGHIEFLKNMISGAARAQAAVLVIDAKEGIQENSRRHGYLMSMLGVQQIAVAVNKMDLVDYGEKIFQDIVRDYSDFLENIHIVPKIYIPISAREGDNVVVRSSRMPWYQGNTILEAMDAFEKERSDEDKPFRFPVQDIYKFTSAGDDRRIVAGRIESGSIKVGDEVIFLPSMKKSAIASIEGFHTPSKDHAFCGESTGFTLTTQIYIKPGELMCRLGQQADVACSLRVSMFWLGRQAMVKGKRYKMKLATSQTPVWLGDIKSIIDASDLSSVTNKEQIDRHDVAECLLEMYKPVALDIAGTIDATSRFVIVDHYEIAGGGIILDAVAHESHLLRQHIEHRDQHWERSQITPGLRQSRLGQRATFVVFTGDKDVGKRRIAKKLEEALFRNNRYAYYVGLSSVLESVGGDIQDQSERTANLRRLGELAYMFTDAGLVFITTVDEMDDYEANVLKTLTAPGDLLIVNVGENRFESVRVDLLLPADMDSKEGVDAITKLLTDRNVLVEYNL